MMPSSQRLKEKRSAISLLEVVLALAILAIAAAYLAQAMQLATQNALRSQTLTQAELVAESVMNQVISGVIPAQPVSWTPYYSSNPTASTASSNWQYQILNVPTEIQGMIGLQIAVQEVKPGVVNQRASDFFVNRWIIDPNLGLDSPPTEDGAAGTGVPATSTTGATP